MKKLNIALVAHDARKQELAEWCAHNAQWLANHNLFGTGTTAQLLSKIPIISNNEDKTSEAGYMQLIVTPLLSGPLGGDSEISTMIAHGKIDVLIFFCDNLITQGHQQDVGALSRLASLYNIAFATNRTTADLIVTSPLLVDNSYTRVIPPVIERYRNRFAVS